MTRLFRLGIVALVLLSYASVANAAVAGAFVARTSDTTDTSTPSFVGHSIGAEAADRCVVVGVHIRRTGLGLTIESATIQGITANILREVSQGATNTGRIAWISAIVPTGTTADINFVLSGTTLRTGIEVYRVTGADCDTPFATAADSGTADPATTIDVEAGGYAIGACSRFANAAATWTGLTERSDATIETAFQYSSAADTFVSEQTDLAVSCNVTNDGIDSALVVVSFGEEQDPPDPPSGTYNPIIGGGVF